MPTEVIGMQAAITGGTQDALSSVDIPQDGTITGIDWSLTCDLDADGEEIQAEISFIATNQISTNDVRGRLSAIGIRIAFLTSGGSAGTVNKFVGPMEIIVSGGERIYIHAVSTAGVTGNIMCNVHLDVGRPPRRRSARR